MNAKTLKILLWKEVTQIKRNPLIRYVSFVMPILVMSIIPLVATLDVKDVGVAVVDNDHTVLSRRLIADMDASEYLSVTGCHSSYDEAFRQIETGYKNTASMHFKQTEKERYRGRAVNPAIVPEVV